MAANPALQGSAVETVLKVGNSICNGKRGKQAKRPCNTEEVDAVLAGGCRAEQTSRHGFVPGLIPPVWLCLDGLNTYPSTSRH